MVRLCRSTRWPLLFTVLLALAPAPARADDVPAGRVRMEFDGDAQANGDLIARLTIRFPRLFFQTLRQSSPDARRFLQSFGSRRVDYELAAGAVARYDDARAAVVLEMTQLGAARGTGSGRWELEVEAQSEYVARTTDSEGRVTLIFYMASGMDDGALLVGPLRLRLPTGATDVSVDDARHLARWRLAASAGTGPARVSVDMRARERLMSAVYKVYGLGAAFAAHWVGKAVIRNEGASLVRDLRVRWRVEGYSEWCPWQKFAEVVPGQTVVAVYYPVLSASVASLSSNTPATLHVEWSYQDASGATHADSDGQRLVLLGGHELVFGNLLPEESYGTWKESHNNAPLMAAWVARDDPAMRQFAAMANRLAGGVGAGSSDENALRVLRSIYELMLANDFTYQHPPGLVDRSVSFDPQMVQTVKHPRDVLRDRSGTCIDLAIFMASAGHAVALEPLLAAVPGHVFPVFRLPSGTLIGVESTGVRGGLRFGSLDFGKALDLGRRELRQWQDDGRLFLIDIRQLWSTGVSSPELEPLPSNALELWGIREPAPAPPATPTTTPAKPPPPPAAAACPAPVQPFAGRWGATVQLALNQVPVSWQTTLTVDCRPDGSVTVDFRARGPWPTKDKNTFEADIQETLLGTVQGGVLRAKGETMNVRALSDNSTVQLAGDALELSIVNGRLVGKFSGVVDIALDRR